MTEKIKELLAVLDMPDSQQRLWLFTHIGKDTSNDRDLADLAFRLRDEVDLELWERAAWIVETWVHFPNDRNDIEWILGHAESRYHDHDPEMTASFLQQKAQPIHWIIAALIAKELSKDG